MPKSTDSKKKKEKKEGTGKKHRNPPKKKSRKMKKFTVSGTFMMGDTLQKFEKEVEALGENRARERILQDLGSKHRVKRSRVLITAVEAAK
jgi:large subunit ribosomal protein LX